MSKDTNIYKFLKAVPHLKTIGNGLIIRLAETKFQLSPEALALLIQIATDGGGFYEN